MEASLAEQGNVFRQSAPLAWLLCILFLVTWLWPASPAAMLELVGLHRQAAPATPWPLLPAALALAVLLSLPRLWPQQRALACKVLALALFAACVVAGPPGLSLGSGLLAGNIFREGGTERKNVK